MTRRYLRLRSILQERIAALAYQHLCRNVRHTAHVLTQESNGLLTAPSAAPARDVKAAGCRPLMADTV